MGIVIASLELLSKFVVAVASRLAADEVTELLPLITGSISRFAVALLPDHVKDCYEAEWESLIWETPGRFGKIFRALDLVRGACQIVLIERAFAPFGRALVEDENVQVFTDEVLGRLSLDRRCGVAMNFDQDLIRTRDAIQTAQRLHQRMSKNFDDLRAGMSDSLTANVIWILRYRNTLRRLEGTILRSSSRLKTAATDLDKSLLEFQRKVK